MRHNVYSVYDRASGVYDRPWVAHSDAAAQRAFSDIALDAEHPIGKHPDDFTLFRIGTWTDDKGLLVGETPEKVINGAEVVSASQKIEPGSLQKPPGEMIKSVQ